jgi:radical SAM protein (TIGR04043 family)
MNLKRLCVELQSLGVRVPEQFSGKKGGAGPSEGNVIMIDGHYISVPTQSWFVASSPYRIEKDGSDFVLFYEQDSVCKIQLPTRPAYYDLETESGIALDKIALIHGSNCLASTVYQDCVYWNTDNRCAFCGIGISLAKEATVLEKEPQDLGYAAEMARRLDNAEHVTLTSGAWADEDQGIDHILRCIESIKSGAAIPVHVQICPPREMDVFDRLKESGADTVGVHIETCSMDILNRIAPPKAHIGWDRYIKSWERAVSVFGKNQVSSFIIAGIGEKPDGILNGAELLCSRDVFPYVLPLRPVPGTVLETNRPPAPEEMIFIYEGLSSLLRKYNLSSDLSKAGCVRCGACSALALFEKE